MVFFVQFPPVFNEMSYHAPANSIADEQPYTGTRIVQHRFLDPAHLGIQATPKATDRKPNSGWEPLANGCSLVSGRWSVSSIL